MSRQSLIVVDNFYEKPDQIRKLALSLEYHKKPGATYPGMEAVAADHNWIEIRQRLRSYINDPCDAPCPKIPEFAQGKFRLATASDELSRVDMVHIDVQDWSAVVYLSKPKDCQGGIALYRHKPTGSVLWPDAWFEKHYSHLADLPVEELKKELLIFFRDKNQFEQIGLIPMAYNRAIILMAKVFHGTGKVFGKDKNSSRLSQHFEFYSE